jgi:hypothetical protein
LKPTALAAKIPKKHSIIRIGMKAEIPDGVSEQFAAGEITSILTIDSAHGLVICGRSEDENSRCHPETCDMK